MDSGSSKDTSAVGNEQDSTATTTADRNTNSGTTTSGGLGEVEAESPHTDIPSVRPATGEDAESGAAQRSGRGDVEGENAYTGSSSGGSGSVNTRVLARITCNDKAKFTVKTIVGNATISVSEDVVQEAMLSGVPLDIDEQIRVYFIDSMGTGEKMTPIRRTSSV